MARKEKELYVYTVSIKCVGTEEDYLNFLRAVAQEYPAKNLTKVMLNFRAIHPRLISYFQSDIPVLLPEENSYNLPRFQRT